MYRMTDDRYKHKETKISIDITCVGLTPALPIFAEGNIVKVNFPVSQSILASLPHTQLLTIA